MNRKTKAQQQYDGMETLVCMIVGFAAAIAAAAGLI